MADPVTDQAMIRDTLAQLAKRHRETLAGLSRMLNRDPEYLGRFIRRGVPLRLRDEEIRILSAYLRVDPAYLGGRRTRGPAASRR